VHPVGRGAPRTLRSGLQLTTQYLLCQLPVPDYPRLATAGMLQNDNQDVLDRKQFPPRQGSRLLSADELGGEVNQHKAVALADAAEKQAQPVHIASRLAVQAPVVAVGILDRLRQRRRFGRLLPIVEKVVQGNFQRLGEFFQGRQGRNGPAVLQPGDVGTLQPSALLDVSRSEERRVGKSGNLGGPRIIKKKNRIEQIRVKVMK